VSFRRLVVGLTFLAVFTMAVRVSVDTDTWWHLRAGAWMTEQGQILRTDPFSLTRQGEPWVYPGWLAQVILYVVYRVFGIIGLNLLTSLMVVIAFIFIWSQLDAPPLLRAFVLILATTVSGVYWSARPHIFSFALTGIFLCLLARTREKNLSWLWLLPPLMALWINLHGGFVIGLILIGIYLAGEAIEVLLTTVLGKNKPSKEWHRNRSRILTLIAVGFACVAAVSLNPHGPQMLLYPFKTVSVGVLQDLIQEWQSPNFHRSEVQPFLWMLLLIMVSLSLSRRRVHAVELLMVTSFSYMSFLAARNIALFALVAAPVLARHSYAILEPHLHDRVVGPQVPERFARGLNVVLFFLMTLAALIKVAGPLSSEVNLEAIEASVPVEAVKKISIQQPAGPLFNSYNWGGYVLWSLFPEYMSFVDGRTDLFGDEILREYLMAWRAEPGWEQVIIRWDIQLALLEPYAPLARVLQDSGWEKLYGDEQAVVLANRTGP